MKVLLGEILKHKGVGAKQLADEYSDHPMMAQELKRYLSWR